MERIFGLISMVSLVILAVLFGIYAAFTQRFPAPEINVALRNFDVLWAQWFEEPISIVKPGRYVDYPVTAPERASTGLLLVTAIDAEQRNFVDIIDRSGGSLHRWYVDWFDHGPDPGFVPEHRRPKVRPGGMLDGIVMLEDGSLILNIDHLTTLRMDFCGEVMWQQKNLGHHFVVPARDGAVWVGAEVNPAFRNTRRIPNHSAATRDWTIQKISVDGEILDELNILDLIYENDMLGLLHLSALHNESTWAQDDTLHLNDVDEFPDDLEPGVFQPGDLMVSLRNINAILVVDPVARKIKDLMLGPVLRHHDPEFLSGDRILIYDNRNLLPIPDPEVGRSRIVEYNFRTGAFAEVYQTEEIWFSQILGKQQLLPNGNLIVTVATQGQAIEITPEGAIAWAWGNEIGEKGHALVTEVSELPPSMDRAFIDARKRGCPPG